MMQGEYMGSIIRALLLLLPVAFFLGFGCIVDFILVRIFTLPLIELQRGRVGTGTAAMRFGSVRFPTVRVEA